MEHELKVWPEFYKVLETGEKTFELRKDDRGFHAGDVLWLREWSPRTNAYTGREMRRRVSYLISGNWGLERDYVCMALAAAPVPCAASPADAQPICMFCDGCGWCEGSPAFTCPRCKGTGVNEHHGR